MVLAEFNGKYRAIVTDTNDPKNMGRIKVRCPKISGGYTTAWCEPCFSCSSDFFIPPVGASVWVEFQQGDLKKPIWSGGWCAENGAPVGVGTRIISYGGATITLTGGMVLINGVNVVGSISSLEKKIESLEKRIESLERRI